MHRVVDHMLKIFVTYFSSTKYVYVNITHNVKSTTHLVVKLSISICSSILRAGPDAIAMENDGGNVVFFPTQAGAKTAFSACQDENLMSSGFDTFAFLSFVFTIVNGIR